MKTEYFTGNPPYSITSYSPARWWGWGGDDHAGTLVSDLDESPDGVVVDQQRGHIYRITWAPPTPERDIRHSAELTPGYGFIGGEMIHLMNQRRVSRCRRGRLENGCESAQYR